MEAQPPEIEHHRKEAVGSQKTGDHRSQKEETRGLYHRHTPEVSTPGEPLGSRGVRGGGGSFATSSSHSAENLRPVHETRGASRHMLR